VQSYAVLVSGQSYYLFPAKNFTFRVSTLVTPFRLRYSFVVVYLMVMLTFHYVE